MPGRPCQIVRRFLIVKALIGYVKVLLTALMRALYLALFQSWPRMLMRCGMLSLRSSRGRSTKFSASLMNTCSQVEDRMTAMARLLVTSLSISGQVVVMTGLGPRYQPMTRPPSLPTSSPCCSIHCQ